MVLARMLSQKMWVFSFFSSHCWWQVWWASLLVHPALGESSPLSPWGNQALLIPWGPVGNAPTALHAMTQPMLPGLSQGHEHSPKEVWWKMEERSRSSVVTSAAAKHDCPRVWDPLEESSEKARAGFPTLPGPHLKHKVQGDRVGSLSILPSD